MGREKIQLPIHIKSLGSSLRESSTNRPETARAYYEWCGFSDFEEKDKLFFLAMLPEGWTYKSSGYWVHVYDKNGLQRFSYFCKQCFYEEDGFLLPNTRFKITRDYGEYDPLAHVLIQEYVLDSDGEPSGDNGTRIYECQPILLRNNSAEYDYHTEEARILRKELAEHVSLVEKIQIAECEEWLNKHFPDWHDIYAYWDLQL